MIKLKEMYPKFMYINLQDVPEQTKEKIFVQECISLILEVLALISL